MEQQSALPMHREERALGPHEDLAGNSAGSRTAGALVTAALPSADEAKGSQSHLDSGAPARRRLQHPQLCQDGAFPADAGLQATLW